MRGVIPIYYIYLAHIITINLTFFNILVLGLVRNVRYIVVHLMPSENMLIVFIEISKTICVNSVATGPQLEVN